MEQSPGRRVLGWISERLSLLLRSPQTFVCDKERQAPARQWHGVKTTAGSRRLPIRGAGWPRSPADGGAGRCWLCDLVTDSVEEESVARIQARQKARGCRRRRDSVSVGGVPESHEAAERRLLAR